MKKTERIFTKIHSINQLISLFPPRVEKPVFRFPVGRSFDAMTYREFYNLILTEAAALKAEGLAGERVAVIGETSPQWLASYLAVICSGGVVVPMDKELEVKEIEGFLEQVEAKAIFFSKSFNKKFAETVHTHKTIQKFIPFLPDEGMEGENIIPYETFLEKGKKALDEGYLCPQRNPEDLAVMLFTSGTTGTSKCVMLSEKNLTTAINAACASVEFFPDDVIVSVLPLHHTYELSCVLASFDYGFTVGINDSLRHLLRNFQEFRPTGLVLVPLFITTMHKKIWDEAKKKGKEKLLRRMIRISNALRKVGIDLRRVFFKSVLSAFGGELRKIISGGAPLNPQMVKAFDDFGVQICEGYGITECSPLISVTPYYAPKVGSVGPTVPDCTARIAVTGQNDKGYGEGEIQVKGGNVMLGYYKNDEENQRAFTEDGWYRTGDVGYMDEDGYIFITGRMKSVIVLENGKNVFPEEIEEYLADIPEILESVVVGRKVEGSDTVNLTALVFPNMELFPEGATKEDAYRVIYEKITALNKDLPSFKKIKDLEIRDTEFEKTTSRKIKRHLVK